MIPKVAAQPLTVLSVVGARPQFVKAAPLSLALANAGLVERLVHTGQHYDYRMSEAFFAELAIPAPWRNLDVGSSSHGRQTAIMLERLEAAIVEAAPSLALVYGDTNSTLAGALAASKLGVPVAHVEAGLRSRNRGMPEEINRVVTDHLSSLLFCPSDAAVSNLASEGIREGVVRVGDLMIEPLRAVASDETAVAATLARHGVAPRGFVLLTVHRAENTDDPSKLSRVLDVIEAVGIPVVFPVHPRTRARLHGEPDLARRLAGLASCHATGPLGHGETIRLLSAAQALLTDSGGMQKEAYWLGVPCVTLRGETEWIETVEAGWNHVTGLDSAAVRRALAKSPPASRPPLYEGAEVASAAIASAIVRFLRTRRA